jgi:exosortase
MLDTDVIIIILAGTRDFGRCPIASRLPMPLWSFAGKPVLSRMLANLERQGVKKAIICSNGDSSLLSRVITLEDAQGLDVEFLDEPLPIGTAGSVRDTMKGRQSELLLIFPAAMINPPDIASLVTEHISNNDELTVAFNPVSTNDRSRGEAASIYVCNSSVLQYIPAAGYFDIKESLMPELIKAGKRVRYTVLPENIGGFRDWRGYLAAVSEYLENVRLADIDIRICDQNDKYAIWAGSRVYIDPLARIFGRVILLDDVRVEAGAVIFGPAVLERNVHIGSNSIAVNSVLWNNSIVGSNCEVRNCVFDHNAVIQDNCVINNGCVANEPKSRLKTLSTRFLGISCKAMGVLHEGKSVKSGVLGWSAAGILFAAFVWSYWSGILDLWNIWQESDEYSSGLLVPFVALYILWLKRGQLAEIKIKPSFWGIPMFLAAQSIRFFGIFFMFDSAERLSIVLSIAAVVLLLFGWRIFSMLSPVMIFLLLMLPWPARIQDAVAQPLQTWATSSAVFCLEIFGYEVIREGNVIHIGDISVAVAEACNGLRMITAFFVIGGMVALLVRRKRWEKIIVFVSSLPIALFCNTVRLTGTAIAFTILKGERWEKLFHDFGGYAMMPIAIVIIMAEIWLLTRLTTPPKQDAAASVRTVI